MHIAEHDDLIIGYTHPLYGYQTARFRVVHALPDHLVVKGVGGETVLSKKSLNANNMDVVVVPKTPWWSWLVPQSNKTE